ncbi:hypothetical protein TNCV_4942971 [Trichonephila clavipes]|nr:hypothetical protein TNCV_4942971 [Trichonephila clavipes]
MMIPAYYKKECAAFLSRDGNPFQAKDPKKIQPYFTRDSNPNPLGYKPRATISNRGFGSLPPVQTTDICHYTHEGTESQLGLNSDPLSLQESEGWYQSQPCVEGFTDVVIVRGDQPFGSRSRHSISGNACSGRVNISTGHVIKGFLYERVQV